MSNTFLFMPVPVAARSKA